MWIHIESSIPETFLFADICLFIIITVVFTNSVIWIITTCHCGHGKGKWWGITVCVGDYKRNCEDESTGEKGRDGGVIIVYWGFWLEGRVRIWGFGKRWEKGEGARKRGELFRYLYTVMVFSFVWACSPCFWWKNVVREPMIRIWLWVLALGSEERRGDGNYLISNIYRSIYNHSIRGVGEYLRMICLCILTASTSLSAYITLYANNKRPFNPQYIHTYGILL